MQALMTSTELCARIDAMDALLVLVVFSLLLALIFLLIFLRAVIKGEFSDTQTPGIRMLHEDSTTPQPTIKS
jgi:cbb3-type cytochrome oxidase maturation protein